MSETELYGKILREYSHLHTRLFRTNAGVAWQGTVIERSPTRLVLANPRPLHMGASGMSDLIGWSPHVCNGDRVMVGKNLFAVYTAVEVKGKKTRVTEEQQAFIDIVNACGGRAGIARSVEDAGKILYGWDHNL